MQKLTQFGAKWVVVDPHISHFKLEGNTVETIELAPNLLTEAELVLIATNHSMFDYDMILQKATFILDTRNIINSKYISSNYNKL